jgi:hypothetical protein
MHKRGLSSTISNETTVIHTGTENLQRLTADMIALFKMGIAHQIGACTPDGRPVLCRGLAATVEESGKVAVLLSAESGFEVLDAIRETAWIALNVTVPSTYQSLHLKGRDAVSSKASPMHRPLLEASHRAFRDQVMPFGFTPEFTHAWYDVTDDDLRVVRFTPLGAWNQTPGPGAGNRLDLSIDR